MIRAEAGSTIGEGVSRFNVEFEVANYGDMVDARRGFLEAGKIRRVKLEGTVNPDVMRLVLPAAVAKRLGLASGGKIRVQYPDGRRAIRERVADVHLELCGRDGVFWAILEPERTTTVIGAMVLSELDFVVDRTHQRLVPRDPRFMVSEIE